MVTDADLSRSGWRFPEGFADTLSEYENKFVAIEFLAPRTFEYYVDRLDYLDFTKLENVLDAGCGMGQWSVALAARNGRVQGIDVDERRVRIAEILARGMNESNRCEFRVGPLEALPYADATFDGVFCYGVFMFTDMPTTLREFRRVLKPGGKFYLNANTWGWYAHLVFDVGWNRRAALRFLFNTVLGRSRNIVVTERWLRSQLAIAGLRPVAIAQEGSTSFGPPAGIRKPAPGYPECYYGMRAILEAIGCTDDSAHRSTS